MKLIDLPDYAKKYKTKGYDVKKINNEFYLYKVDHKRVDDKPYPVTSLTYIGKIAKVKITECKTWSLITYSKTISVLFNALFLT